MDHATYRLQGGRVSCWASLKPDKFGPSVPWLSPLLDKDKRNHEMLPLAAPRIAHMCVSPLHCLPANCHLAHGLVAPNCAHVCQSSPLSAHKLPLGTWVGRPELRTCVSVPSIVCPQIATWHLGWSPFVASLSYRFYYINDALEPQ